MSDTPTETPGADTASQAASRAAARAAAHAARASARAARSGARSAARPVGAAPAAPAAEASAAGVAAAATAATTTDAGAAPAAAAAPAPAGNNQAVHTATAALALIGRAVQGFKLPRPRMPRPRLLPGIMFVAALMVGVRTNDLVQGLTAEALDPGQPAQAQTIALAQAPEAEPPAAPAPSQPEMLASLPGEERMLSDSERALLEGLSARRTALDDRERALDQRAALIAVAEQRLTEKTTELEALRAQIEAMIEVVNNEREAQLTNLVGIYENMRPGDAAAIFNGLDLDVLLDVLDRMREQKSAPILANMNPVRAREVTTELARRQAFPTAAN